MELKVKRRPRGRAKLPINARKGGSKGTYENTESERINRLVMIHVVGSLAVRPVHIMKIEAGNTTIRGGKMSRATRN